MQKHKLPKGFLANGILSGVKKKRKDLSLLYSEKSCKAAALFTKNTVKAAPVILAREQLRKNGRVRAVVINSGNANCMTGRQGIADAKKIARTLAGLLKVPEDSVLGSSTGIIGETMPMKPILKGLSEAVRGLSTDGIVRAADGIMTTDKFHKISSREFVIGGKKVVMTGIAKGAGMIDPNMATMLGYIMTDANISKRALKKALSYSTEISFNAITVDGDMSTNDTVMLLANGMAGNRIISETGKDFNIFQENLDQVSRDLALMIVRDGEGASKVIEVHARGARTAGEAKELADAIASSMLVKCAVLGGDPNWGRIASSAGSTGIGFDPNKVEITLDGVVFFKNGRSVRHVDRKKTSIFKGKEAGIAVNFHMGKSEAVVYSCDISKKYVRLNSYYTT